MKASDPELLRLAALAKVRPAHIWHLLAFMKEQKAKFRPEAFAHFNGLELRHVTAMLATLEAEDMGGTRPQVRTQQANATRLPEDFIIPPDWLQWAQVQRSWSLDVAKTEAESFADYWLGTGKAMVSWQATWRNWCRRSRTPNGTRTPVNAEPADFKTICQRGIEIETRRGNRKGVEEWRKKLSACD